MKKEMPSQRNSQIELIRIIAIFLIVFHHMAAHGYQVISSDFLLQYMPYLNDSMWAILLTGLILGILFLVVAAVIELVRRPLFKMIETGLDRSGMM